VAVRRFVVLLTLDAARCLWARPVPLGSRLRRECAVFHRCREWKPVSGLVTDANGVRWLRRSVAEWKDLLGVSYEMLRWSRSLLVRHRLIVVRPWGYDDGDPRGLEYALGPRPDREIG